MPLERNSPSCTPTRHDELSISRKSLRTRVLISANTWKENICNENKENKGTNMSHVLSSTRICDTSLAIKREDKTCFLEENSMWEESSLRADVTPVEEMVNGNSMDSFSSDHSSDHMEVSIVQLQKHSTPQQKKFSARAASSTPNLEMFNINRFSRNVFIQTNFTLNARDQDCLSSNLKPYCSELPAPGDESQYEQSLNISSDLNTTTELTSPLSHLCSSELDRHHKTPVKNKQSMRKLSLRSKTMICSAIENSKDVPKKILSRHKSMEEKRLNSNTFSLMPQYRTPPSCTGKVLQNPFEIDLPNRLSKTIFSPNVFQNVVSPSQDSEELRWTIEDISSINPVPIDEDFSVPSEDEDPEKESLVQQEIDRYFSETHIVLSPDDLPKSSSDLEILKSNLNCGTASSTPRKVNVNSTKELKNSSTQTTLSFPEILPAELEESLSAYFKYFQDDDLNQSQCNLRRKLFFHKEDEPPSPVRFEMKSSPLTKDMWKAESSPLSLNSKGRLFTPLGRTQELSSPEMSPVVGEIFIPKLKNESLMTCKKTLHNFFLVGSETMATERKIGMVNSSEVTSSDMEGSSQPASQDTGYQTEDSVSSHLHFSTPTRINILNL